MSGWEITRRRLLASSALAMAVAAVPAVRAAMPNRRLPATAAPLPLADVRLHPSDFATAIESNRAYLGALEPDRFLHNFRKYAGLEPKGEIYGGWESDTIAGHCLGHYMTAAALMYAQTGDQEMKRRLDYIVDELSVCQQAHGDGYVAGFDRRVGDVVENGKVLFAELMAGDIRSKGFDLNGCWVPFYNWHKLFDGLFQAQTLCGNEKALGVAAALGGYIDNVFAHLDEAQVQEVLDCEHGGINESFAELYARTQDARWLALAERLRHRKILDPLEEGVDSIAHVHANTQIPKVIGLARLHELTGAPGDQKAVRFFWNTVVHDYTYVIGGNADREYFQAPNTISKHITEQTCESCNTYNMLKLSRHLFGWQPDGAYFDYYERAHLNHILAHQDPSTGMFAYMVPLMSGTNRDYSTPFDSFWCCVGSGMESHAKHGDSIWWQGDDTLFVNLFIPSELRWTERDAMLTLATQYPFDEEVTVTVDRIGNQPRFQMALRVPQWAQGAALEVNGKPHQFMAENGYALVDRDWSPGDRVTLRLPLTLREEATPDDPGVVALLHGPLVLAADLGPAGEDQYVGPAPALVAADILQGFAPVNPGAVTYRTRGIGRPADLEFAPFHRQWHRRTAVYFRKFDEAGWEREKVAYAAEEARRADLAARSVDVMHLGEMQAERDHELESHISYPGTYRGRHGRDARAEGYFEFKMKVRPGPLILQATYWGGERNKMFDILIDGTVIATQVLEAELPGDFFDVEYPIPETLTRGRQQVQVRFQPSNEETRCGPVYGVRIFTAQGTPA